MAFCYNRLWPTLIGLCLLYSCTTEKEPHRGRSAAGKPKEAAAFTPVSTYTIFLETSGSLDGYLKPHGEGSFRTNLSDFINLLDGLPGKRILNLYEVSSKVVNVFPGASVDQVSDYLDRLNPEAIRSRAKASKASRGESDMPGMIKALLDSLHGDEVNVLVTDAVLSPGKRRDAEHFLDDQSGAIERQVTAQLRTKPASLLVLQYYADFNGKYFDQNDKPCKGIYRDRPYYMICAGNEEALRTILDEVQHSGRFQGFQNFLFLSDRAQYPVTARIRNSNRHYDYSPRQPMTVHNMRQDPRDHRFRLRLLADLSKVPADNAYLQHPQHYRLSQGGFVVDSVVLSGEDLFTHEIVLSAKSVRPGLLKLSLQKQLPLWVASSALDSDKDISADSLRGKTLGIRQLLGGMFQAYQSYTRQDTYFSIPVTIKE